jgi:hypothetical protein
VTVLAGPFVIACAVLALGGAAKAVRPDDTARALRALRLPHARWLVRVGGAVEVVIALGALVVGGPMAAALVALSYVVFAAFVVAARRSGTPLSSCGCFGRIDTPPTTLHVVLDLVAAGVAAAVAFGQPPVALADVVADQPLLGIPFLLLAVTGTYLVFLAFTALPKTLAAARAVEQARG